MSSENAWTRHPPRGCFGIPCGAADLGYRGCRVGGCPGVVPTVLVGNDLLPRAQDRHRRNAGEFTRSDAERVIREQEDYSQRTGNPCMLDVVGATPKRCRRHLEFVGRVSDSPLLIDGTTVDVRLAGLGVRRRNRPGRTSGLQLDPARGHGRRTTGDRERPACKRDPADLLPAGLHGRRPRASRPANCCPKSGRPVSRN